jgi:hypothetical protein
MGMAAGFTVVCLGRMFNLFAGVDPLIPAIVANLAFYMGSHYILAKFGILESKVISTTPIWVRIIKQTGLYTYIRAGLATHGLVYSLLGIYTIEATYTAFLCFKDYQTLYLFMAFILLTVIFIVLYEYQSKPKN